jgi:radical SAM superfamily enzyme
MINEIKEMFEKTMAENEARCNSRTVNNIKLYLLHEIANCALISGKQDYHDAHYKLTKAEIMDQELSDSLTLIAKKVLDLFPNKNAVHQVEEHKNLMN